MFVSSFLLVRTVAIYLYHWHGERYSKPTNNEYTNINPCDGLENQYLTKYKHVRQFIFTQ